MRSPDWATLARVVGTAKRPDCLVIIPPGEKGPREVGWPNNPKNLATVEQRFKINPDLNVGILLGPSTGIIDIEVDGPDGLASLAKLCGGNVPEPTFNSSKGGHWLAFYDPAFDHLPAKVTADEFPGLEFRIGTKAAQTALPPSTSNGFTRTWASGNVIQLPPDVVQRIADLRTPRVEAGGVEWEVIEQVENGLRDKALATVQGWIPVSHGEPELVGSSYRIRIDRCPHRPDQDDGAPAVFVNPGGRVVYECKHSKCAHRTINDLVELWGPIKRAATVEPRPSRFTILSSAALAAMAIEIVWLIRGVLVAGQHAILGGNQKTLKT
ncbi:MAG TPA: bifunctional DNA primase/polymerase, partial [Lacipirellulaceae bacterium]|nr:bifunctional DNA primase/polymerase [Lacipirellulaceae bacterium]